VADESDGGLDVGATASRAARAGGLGVECLEVEVDKRRWHESAAVVGVPKVKGARGVLRLPRSPRSSRAMSNDCQRGAAVQRAVRVALLTAPVSGVGVAAWQRDIGRRIMAPVGPGGEARHMLADGVANVVPEQARERVHVVDVHLGPHA